MDWWQPLNVVCERGDSHAFWAEPWNAWTNVAFLVAAAAALPHILRAGSPPSQAHGCEAAAGSPERRPPLDLLLLNLILVGIAVGSFCFHTYAVVWAAQLDVGFIVLWLLVYLVIYAARVLGWRWWQVGLALAGFLAVTAALLAVGGFRPGYLPTLVTVAALAGHARHAAGDGSPPARRLAAAAAAFGVSLTAACLDDHEPTCEAFPLGTHWAWHVFNALALYLSTVGLAGLIRARRG